MNRIISINIKGLIFQIEEEAYQELSSYLDRLKNHFRNTEGGGEIIDDIESRIAEMLSKNPGANGCVTLGHVTEIIRIMGNPTDFDETGEPEPVATPSGNYSHRKTRKLFRDPESRMLGGVCSGLGAYFEVDPIWFRLAFLVAFFTFGTGLLIYVILWVIVPEARTAADRLEMKGEKVTIDNIEKTVTEEFERIKKKFGDHEAGRRAAAFTREAGNQVQSVLGRVLRIALKLFGVFLVFLVSIIVLVLFLTYLGFLSNHIHLPFFPFFRFLFEDPYLALAFQVCCVLLLVVPLLSIAYAGARLISGRRNGSSWFGKTLGILFTFSLAGFLAMWIYLANAWGNNASLNHEQEWAAPDTLYIASGNIDLYKQSKFTIEFGSSRGFKGIYGWQNDSLKRPVSLNILPATNKKVLLQESRESNGKTQEQAAELASHIESSYAYEKNTLLFNPYFAIPQSDVWRNQKLVYNLYIPLGTVVVFEKNTPVFLNNIESESYINRNHLEGKTFRMTANGLQAKPGDNPTFDEYEQTYSFSDFDEVVINGGHDVEIIDSDTFFVGHTGHNNGYTDVRKEGRTLYLTSEGVDLLSQNDEKWMISLPACKKITSNGKNAIRLGFGKQTSVSVELNGTTDLQGTFSGNVINILSKGVSQVELRGRADLAIVEFQGAGNFIGEGLVTRECRIRIAGGAIASVYSTEKFVADADGASKITYYGKPKDRQINKNGISVVEEGNR